MSGGLDVNILAKKLIDFVIPHFMVVIQSKILEMFQENDQVRRAQFMHEYIRGTGFLGLGATSSPFWTHFPDAIACYICPLFDAICILAGSPTCYHCSVNLK